MLNMSMFNRSIRRAGIAAIVIMTTVTAVAFAAAPTKGGSYGDCGKRTCKVNDIVVSKNGKTIDLFRTFTKCNPIPFAKDPGGFKITKAGAFAFTGVKRDFTGHNVKVVITGKFVSSKLIRGTIRYSTTAPKRCDTKTTAYAAKLGAGRI
jgi:hypothetical protein